jgi:hypothetical protein
MGPVFVLPVFLFSHETDDVSSTYIARSSGFPAVEPGNELASMISDACLKAGIALNDGDVEVIAIGRLVLHPLLPNIQTSWVKMGGDGARICLQNGANDLGGTLMEESITRAAGAIHGQEMTPAQLQDIAYAAGRVPRQRTTLYGVVGDVSSATAPAKAYAPSPALRQLNQVI